MTLHWKVQVALVVLGVGLLMGGYSYWAHVQREYGKRDLLIAQAERTNADLRHAQDSLANVYRVDTLRLTTIRRVTDSLTVTVDRWKHDTVRVVEYVAKADTAIRVCTAALHTCEARVGVAQRGWAVARQELTVLKASFPSPVAKWRDRVVGGLVGGLIVYVAKP